MKINGSADHQKSLPAELVGKLRTGFAEMGYGHEEISLTITGLQGGGPQYAGIQLSSCNDKSVFLTLQGPTSNKRFTARIDSSLATDSGSALMQKIGEVVKTTSPKPSNGAANGIMVDRIEFPIKVFNLMSPDKERFPVIALNRLVCALERLNIQEDIVLKHEVMVRSDPETPGVCLDEDSIEADSIELSLQDHHPSTSKSRCLLRINNGEDGMWLYTNLAKSLSEETETAPKPKSNGAIHPAPERLPVKTAPSAPSVLRSITESEDSTNYAYLNLLKRTKESLAGAKQIDVPYSEIRPYPDQPRKYFDPESLKRLSLSIETGGQTTRGLIRKKVSTTPYELIDGERRWRSIGLIVPAHRPLYKAEIIEADDDVVQFLIAGMANFNREGHTTLEVTDTIVRLHEGMHIPMKEVADLLGIHILWAYNMYGLRKLPPEVKAMLDQSLPKERRLAVTAAIELSKMDSPKHQIQLAHQVVSKAIPLSTLRSEVVKTGDSAGVTVRSREVNPLERWRSTIKRTGSLMRTTADFEKYLKSVIGDTPSTFASHSGETEQQLAQLKTVRDSVDRCIKLIEGAKTPTT